MMLDRLRRYDVQANYSLVLALLGLVPFAMALWLALSRYDSLRGLIVYGTHGRFLPAYVGFTLLSLAPAGLALILGASSANQRRNEHSVRSWIGFFLGGAVATLDIILLIALYMLRFEQVS